MVEKQGATEVKKTFAEAGIRPAAFGLPVEWRKTDGERVEVGFNDEVSPGVIRCEGDPDYTYVVMPMRL